MRSIQNYYEGEVTHQIEQMAAQFPQFNEADLLDVTCIALNKFPAKYYRHGIDLKFYMTNSEQREIETKVSEAIHEAAAIVLNNPRPE